MYQISFWHLLRRNYIILLWSNNMVNFIRFPNIIEPLECYYNELTWGDNWFFLRYWWFIFACILFEIFTPHAQSYLILFRFSTFLSVFCFLFFVFLLAHELMCSVKMYTSVSPHFYLHLLYIFILNYPLTLDFEVMLFDA